MGAGAVATTGVSAAYGHLIDPNRKWYNNKRYAAAFLYTLQMLTLLQNHLPQLLDFAPVRDTCTKYLLIFLTSSF